MNLILLKEIYFIRHGETEWNVTEWNIINRLQGCENDIPLNKNGIE